MIVKQGDIVCDLKYATMIRVEGENLIVEFITGSKVSLKINDPRIVNYIAKNKNADVFYDLNRSDFSENPKILRLF
jgi:adenylate cyclase class IV